MFGHIANHDYAFDYKEEIAGKILQQLTKEDLVAHFEATFGEKAKSLEVHVVPEIHAEAQKKLREERLKTEKFVEIEDIDSFRNGLKIHPDFLAFK